jgi:hypothetical protein
VRELVVVGGKVWWALVPGLIFGALSIVQAIRGSHHAPWFWAFLAALTFALVLARVAYRALWTRDKALHGALPMPPVVHAKGGSSYGTGGAGGVGVGPGAVGEGGKAAPDTPSAFESLAKASLGMGYTLDEFMKLAGFDARGEEIDRIGRGGDARADGPSDSGGDGLVVLTSKDDDGTTVQVDVFKADGHHTAIRPKGALGAPPPDQPSAENT